MVYGDKEAWFIEEAIAGDHIAIKAINSQPRIEPYRRFFWVAFWELCSDRPVLMGGVGMIPFTSIDRYARRFGVNDLEQFKRFAYVIRRLDSVYVEKTNEKLSKVKN